jgi:AcrR family transcriptional regulator
MLNIDALRGASDAYIWTLRYPSKTMSPPLSRNRRQIYAEQTKQAIIEAARQLFASKGYAQTTVEQIAKLAEVAPVTVYAAAGGKGGILRALMEAWSATPKNDELIARVLSERDPREVLARVAEGVRTLREEFGDIAYFMQDAAPHDPEVAKSLEVATNRYRAFFVLVIEHLQSVDSLRPELSVRDAADIGWFYFGYWGYYTLHNENFWSYDKAQLWLEDAAAHALLKPECLPT